MIELGPYELVRPCGSGGAGIVWEALHRPSAERVAVKILAAEGVRDEVFLRSFRNEVRAAARLDHPHVIRVFDHGRVGPEAVGHSPELQRDAPYLVMEWVGGGALRLEALDHFEAVADLAMALMSALAHAHSRGVVHRDLKPSNVLLAGQEGPRPGPRLTDFAGSLRRTQRPGAAPNLGTPAWLPPERLRGAWWEEGPASDLYTLGCMIWRACTGEMPHGGTSAEQIVAGRLRGRILPFAPRFAVPVGVEDWLQRMVEARVGARFASAARALSELIELCGGEVVAIGRPATEIERLIRLAQHGSDLRRPPMSARWRAEEPEDHAPTGRPLGRLELRPVPLGGRELERDRLWAALDRVRRSSRPAMVLLHGPSGFGKSALATWLVEHADQLGLAEGLVALHDEAAGPLHGLGPMLARWLRVQGLPREDALPAIEGRLSGMGIDRTDAALALAELASGEVAVTEMPGRLRFAHPLERHARLRQLLLDLSTRRPVILLLEDLQWGSEARAFLRSLLSAGNEDRGPLLVVGTWATDRQADEVGGRDSLLDLLALPGVEGLPVGPLASGEIEQILRHDLGLQGELAARVEERAEGSPDYVRQLVDTWADRGLLVAGDRGWCLAPGVEVVLPRGEQELWLGRIEPLLATWPSAAVESIEIAAILGRQVDSGEWGRVCQSLGIEPPHALVERLADAGLVLIHDARSWSFVHAMLRESLVERSRRGKRAERHTQACARVLAATGEGRLDGRLGRILAAAGDPIAALSPLSDAAEAAMNGGEYSRAEVLLGELDLALERASLAPDDARLGRAWLLWCRLLRVQGQEDRVRILAQRTVEEGRRHGWRRQVVQGLIFLGRSELRDGRDQQAWQHLVGAEQAAAEQGEVLLRADALRAQGLLLAQRGELPGAAERIEAAIALVEPQGDLLRQAGALLDLAYVARQRAQVDEAGRHAATARALYERAGSRWGVANAHNLEGEIARQRGDIEAAIAHYRTAARRSAAVGGHLAQIPRLNLGLALIEAGRLAEAAESLSAVLGDGGASQGPVFVGTAHAGLAAVNALQGDWDACGRHLDQVGPLMGAGGYVDRDLARTLEIVGRAAATQGQIALARRALDGAARQLRALGDPAAAGAIEALLPDAIAPTA